MDRYRAAQNLKKKPINLSPFFDLMHLGGPQIIGGVHCLVCKCSYDLNRYLLLPNKNKILGDFTQRYNILVIPRRLTSNKLSKQDYCFLSVVASGSSGPHIHFHSTWTLAHLGAHIIIVWTLQDKCHRFSKKNKQEWLPRYD